VGRDAFDGVMISRKSSSEPGAIYEQGSVGSEAVMHIEATAEYEAAALAIFVGERRRLFGIAYRIIGISAAAEDVVQETWMRWQACDRTQVRDPLAFLATVTTRLAINELRSAHSMRETYIGPWLPSPVDTSNDPTLGAERGEALSMAVMVLMERLGPPERAAFTLRQAFDYPYERIAEILETTPAAARKLVSRARAHVLLDGRRPSTAESHRKLFHAFLSAARGGDRQQLETLLADDVVSYSDGGGGVHRTARRPVTGRATVTRFLQGVSEWFWDDVDVQLVDVNGREAAVLRRAGMVMGLLTITAADDRVSEVLWVMSPEKLASFSQPA
jgi:RNA polymerase sigma-70 factor (ECF subfamily)